MTISQQIHASLVSVRNELAASFPHISDDMLDWSPSPGMRTVQGQFVEMITTERAILDRLNKKPRKPVEEEEEPLWLVRSVDGLVKHMTDLRKETLTMVDRLSDEEMAQPAEISPAFAQWLGMDPIPVSELLRFIVRHESYHSGQLISYLWASGDNPYNWD